MLYNNMFMQIAQRTPDSQNLDAIFGALSDPTRRAILSKLAEGQATVAEIGAPFSMSQPAVSRHLKVLEHAGLIERSVDEQRRPAKLKAQNLVQAAEWLTGFKQFWGSSFDQLDGLLDILKHQNDRTMK